MMPVSPSGCDCLLGIDGLMRPMECPDAEMDDANPKARGVKRRLRDRLPRLSQRSQAEPNMIWLPSHPFHSR